MAAVPSFFIVSIPVGQEKVDVFVKTDRKFPVDLAIVVAWIALTIFVAFLPIVNETSIRTIVGVVFVLSLPGYALVAILFPRRGRTTQDKHREIYISSEVEIGEQMHDHWNYSIDWIDPATGEIDQLVSTAEIQRALSDSSLAKLELSDRAVQGILTDLETMGLVETWIESRGRDGRVKQHETTFDPEWVHDAFEERLSSMEGGSGK